MRSPMTVTSSGSTQDPPTGSVNALTCFAGNATRSCGTSTGSGCDPPISSSPGDPGAANTPNTSAAITVPSPASASFRPM